MRKLRASLLMRFLAKVDTRPGQGRDGKCWQWRGALSHGYGVLGAGRRGEGNVRATHYAVFLATGTWPQPDMEVMHLCDTPACVRPTHLRAGTHIENMQDCGRKGRQPGNRKTPGELNPWATLRQVHVDQIRVLLVCNYTCTELARQYGVSRSAVSKIKHNISWAAPQK